MEKKEKRFDYSLGVCDAVRVGKYIVYHDRGRVRRLLRIDSKGELRVYKPAKSIMLSTLRSRMSTGGAVSLEELFD